MQAGKVCDSVFNFSDPLAVSEVVLRIRLVPAISTDQDRRRCNSHDYPQLLASEFDQRCLVLFGEVLRQRATDEDAKQNAIARSAIV